MEKRKKGAKAPETSGCLGLLILTAFLPCLDWQWIIIGGIAFYVTFVAAHPNKDWQPGCLALIMFVILALLIRACMDDERGGQKEKKRHTQHERDVFKTPDKKKFGGDVFE